MAFFSRCLIVSDDKMPIRFLITIFDICWYFTFIIFQEEHQADSLEACGYFKLCNNLDSTPCKTHDAAKHDQMLFVQ